MWRYGITYGGLRCSSKPKGDICLRVKSADTAFWLCTAVTAVWFHTFILTVTVYQEFWIYVTCSLKCRGSYVKGPCITVSVSPADTRRWINVGLPLVQRRRRWANVKPTLIQRLVSAGIYSCLCWKDVFLMLVLRRGNWPNAKPTLGRVLYMPWHWQCGFVLWRGRVSAPPMMISADEFTGCHLQKAYYTFDNLILVIILIAKK